MFALALHCAILDPSAKDWSRVVRHEPASSGGASANTSEKPYERTASDKKISESSTLRHCRKPVHHLGRCTAISGRKDRVRRRRQEKQCRHYAQYFVASDCRAGTS